MERLKNLIFKMLDKYLLHSENVADDLTVLICEYSKSRDIKLDYVEIY